MTKPAARADPAWQLTGSKGRRERFTERHEPIVRDNEQSPKWFVIEDDVTSAGTLLGSERGTLDFRVDFIRENLRLGW